MGSLVIERVVIRGSQPGSDCMVRVSGGLALHIGHQPQLLPLLSHVFAHTAAPDLAAGAVEFALNGAVYQWRCDFALGRCELQNRSTGYKFETVETIRGHLDRELGREYNRRAASYFTPAPEPPPATAESLNVNEPPSCQQLEVELARYEDAMRQGLQAQSTATALYADLFPLLESLEEASEKLAARVRQLERHDEAEEVLRQYRAVETRMQEQVEANRKAHQMEKQLKELGKEEEAHPRIPAEALEEAEYLDGLVEEARAEYNEVENSRRDSANAVAVVQPRRWWATAGIGAAVVAAGLMLRGHVPFALYGVAAGCTLLLGGVILGLVLTLRRSALRKRHRALKERANAARGALDTAELAVMQHLKPYKAVNVGDLRRKQAAADEWHANYDALREELADHRRASGTDDDIQRKASSDSATLVELQDRCRETAHHRLSDVDRQQVEKMVRDLEIEARYQEKTAGVLKSQCEELSEGWSDLAANVEKVSELRMRLAEWQRWERAFQKIREVVDQLPDIQPEPEAPSEVMAADYLRRITAGRWTELRYDPHAGEFTLYDNQAGIWIHADRDNPAIQSTVDLAYRLSLLESGTMPIRLPLWLDEPFEELPDSMAEAAAEVLAEVARRRQVVLVCRQRPQVRWPDGAILQN